MANTTLIGRMPALLAAMSLVGCAPASIPASSAPPDVPPLRGIVQFEPQRRIAATTTEIGTGATVSLIDPVSGNTIATTLTTPSGQFILTFSNNFRAVANQPYFLEGAKGLSSGGGSNRAGASFARLRTLVAFQTSSWNSLSGQNVTLGTTSTALAALSNLRNLNTAQNLALLGTLTINAPSTNGGITTPDTYSGTPDINDTDFHRTWDLVSRALAQDNDPIASLIYRDPASTSASITLAPGFNTRPGIAQGSDGWMLFDVTPGTASAGTPFTIRGQGLPTATSSVTVWIGSATCSVSTASADGTWVTATVPAMATGSYQMEVDIGQWANRTLSFVVQ